MLTAFLRYNLVQIVAYGIDLGTFTVLAGDTKPSLVLANFVSRVAAGCFAFWAHKHFTFKRSQSQDTKRELGHYAILLFATWPVSSTILVLLNSFMPAVAAKIIGDAICVGLSFLATRYVVFSHVPRK